MTSQTDPIDRKQNQNHPYPVNRSLAAKPDITPLQAQTWTPFFYPSSWQIQRFKTAMPDTNKIGILNF